MHRISIKANHMRCLLIICSLVVAMVSGWTQPQQGLIPINDGKLYYEKNGSGPSLVFLHGVCLDHRMWQQQVAYFCKSYTCITVDLRGFGQSSLPTDTPYA